jgi:uncharacterized membrane protein YkvA (DUF1232 family)
MKNQKAAKKAPRVKQKYPRGWNEKRVRELIAYYDNQTEDEAVAEYETAMALQDMTMMLVPRDLVPEIEKLIARKRGA